MRYLKHTLTLAFIFCLVSCLDINENITLNEDGSGTYVTKMDMSAMIEMMQTFAGEEELKQQGLDKAIDTTIFYSSVTDTSGKLSPEQKALLKDGKMKLQLNMQEKIFKIDVSIPYNNFHDLEMLMSGAASENSGMGSVFKDLFGAKDTAAVEETQPDASKEPEMSDFSKVYDITVTNGLISRKLNQEEFKALKEQPEMAQMAQMAGTGMEILMTTTIQLPRPVKESSNPLIKLSDDKKTATIRYNMLDILENPEKYAYDIAY